MVWLPDGENILKIGLFISTESTNVPYGQMYRHLMTAYLATRLRSKNCYFVSGAFCLLSLMMNKLSICRGICWIIKLAIRLISDNVNNFNTLLNCSGHWSDGCSD